MTAPGVHILRRYRDQAERQRAQEVARQREREQEEAANRRRAMGVVVMVLGALLFLFAAGSCGAGKTGGHDAREAGGHETRYGF